MKNMMTIATITAPNGKVSAVPANWNSTRKVLMEAAAAKEGMTITYSRIPR